ncbi:hypothetical protein ACT29H_00035 [Thermophagus sp. OGC60D27]
MLKDAIIRGYKAGLTQYTGQIIPGFALQSWYMSNREKQIKKFIKRVA